MKSEQRWVIVMIGVFAFSSAQADIVITMKEATKFVGDDAAAAAAFFQENGGGNEVTLWSGPVAMVRVDSKNRMISKLASGETYILNEGARSCTIIKLQLAPADREVNSPDFKKTGETREIGEWSTDGYTLSIAGNDDNDTDVTLWVSSEATLGLDQYRDYLKEITPASSYWMVQSLELGGYPIRQEMHFGPVAAWTEIESIRESEPPAGIYEIPDDYEGCEG